MSSVDRLSTQLQETGTAEHHNWRELVQAAMQVSDRWSGDMIRPGWWRIELLDDVAAAGLVDQRSGTA